MIEKGQVPPPELHRVPESPDRARQAGIFLIAIGLGLGTLIAVAGDFKPAIGVGGLLVLLGGAFLVNALLDKRSESKKSLEPKAESREPREP